MTSPKAVPGESSQLQQKWCVAPSAVEYEQSELAGDLPEIASIPVLSPRGEVKEKLNVLAEPVRQLPQRPPDLASRRTSSLVNRPNRVHHACGLTREWLE
jgi:hypothetical protein